jgi:hypothetical protein
VREGIEIAPHSLSPHPEEVEATVSKEDPVLSGRSFETQLSAAPQDEG